MQVGSSTSNLQGDTSSAPFSEISFTFINMIDYTKLNQEEVDFSTINRDYGNLDLRVKGK
jgi:hypothetical protein